MKKSTLCNMCGKTIEFEGEIPKEDYITVHKNWGYFSEKDGKTCRYILCEKCSDKLIESFVVPAEISDTTELL
ncbi:MAG: hypothetical protein ACI4D8_03940 [Wujia sp.]